MRPRPRRARTPFALRAAERATGIRIDPAHRRPALQLPSSGTRTIAEGGRWGLVLGGGGVLGAAWLIGALTALEEARGIDARDADLIISTSAGSVIGALLAAGVSVAEQREQQLGAETPFGLRIRDSFDPDRPVGGSAPPLPRLLPGGTSMLRNNRRSLHELPFITVLAGLAPIGRQPMDGVRALIEAAVPAGQWLPHDRYRAVALDYSSGRRVMFGAPGAPVVGLSDAVLASCAIPGWFQPVDLLGRRYVDGGMWSNSNADLAAGAGLDEVFVLAPMFSASYDEPDDWRDRTERRVRVASTRRVINEARRVQRAGSTVTVLGPGPDDLRLIGHNLMAPSRRRLVLRSAVRSGRTALDDPAVPPDE
ncbi:patatin [Kineosporia sp. NBRC 101677]|uniref:patatin-like phospholipase family protein n=1 Tax=Kineosporia sp. NBRC 101677 TaxID=3032197 RepID=UPI0024A5F886|nr:patatin-like phospholipase family protein [Kineosporia sp. NBRC 101677]GLY14885.1 patatin [Kineosporia sp. NBRC 101677]